MKLGRRVRLRAHEWPGKAPEPGDFLVTRAGSAYLVDQVRPGLTTPPWLLDCYKVDINEIPDEAERVWLWSWAPRRRAS